MTQFWPRAGFHHWHLKTPKMCKFMLLVQTTSQNHLFFSPFRLKPDISSAVWTATNQINWDFKKDRLTRLSGGIFMAFGQMRVSVNSSKHADGLWLRHPLLHSFLHTPLPLPCSSWCGEPTRAERADDDCISHSPVLGCIAAASNLSSPEVNFETDTDWIHHNREILQRNRCCHLSICLSIKKKTFWFHECFLFFVQTCSCPGRQCLAALTRLTVSVLHLKEQHFPKQQSLSRCSLYSTFLHLVSSQSDFCLRRPGCACPNKINLTAAVLHCRLGRYITKHVIAYKRQQIVGENNSRLLTCAGMW